MLEVYNASGDLVYTISGDPLEVKVKNKEIGVNVKNEVLEVSSEGRSIVSVESGDTLPVALVSQDASYNASDYTGILNNISNNSYMLCIGLIMIFTFSVIFKEIRGWR